MTRDFIIGKYCEIPWKVDGDFYCASGEWKEGEHDCGLVKDSEKDGDAWYMSEDITYCDDSDSCKRKTCFRHKCHIKHFEIPHSYAHLKGTNECERKEGDFGGKAD